MTDFVIVVFTALQIFSWYLLGVFFGKASKLWGTKKWGGIEHRKMVIRYLPIFLAALIFSYLMAEKFIDIGKDLRGNISMISIFIGMILGFLIPPDRFKSSHLNR